MKRHKPRLDRVFVYGTLRPPGASTSPADSFYYPKIAKFVRAKESAWMANVELYNLGNYPAAVPGQGTLQGDLLTVERVALTIMDRIEGHPGFYRRAEVVVETKGGPVSAWIYWAPGGVTVGKPQIESGDWFNRNHGGGYLASSATQPAGGPVDATLQKLVQRLAEAECSWLSTTRADGRAHSTPIWHVWYQGRAYLVTTSNAVKLANIQENPGVVIAHQDPVNPVIVEGWALTAPSMRTQLQPLFKAKYDWDLYSDSSYDAIIEITPTKLLAWGKFGEGRWSGTEVQQVWSF